MGGMCFSPKRPQKTCNVHLMKIFFNVNYSGEKFLISGKRYYSETVTLIYLVMGAGEPSFVI